MDNGVLSLPLPPNEPVFSYAPGSPERARQLAVLTELRAREVEVPLVLGGDEVRTGSLTRLSAPHEHAHTLGHAHEGDAQHVAKAVESALKARHGWSRTPWESRAAIFMKAAELIATKYRPYMNGTTMLGQSKNVFQAEVDSACEIIDFLRFNVHFLDQIYRQQPVSGPGMHNRTEWRPLEGFVLAITPFNFTAIGGNLSTAPALCGNVVVWKPAHTQLYSAWQFMQILQEAGLPDGVINLVSAPGAAVGEVAFAHHDLAGVHFTGSTGTFNRFWKAIGDNIQNYRSYPRIVGETGGKDFVLVHPSADVDVVVTALLRGAFEFQGQKCSAASRAYLPSNLADAVLERLIEGVKTFRVGPVEDFRNFINAVIDEKAFDSIAGYLEWAKADPETDVLVGGGSDKSIGYFVQPTVLRAHRPDTRTMVEEIFGPILTVYVYDEADFEGALHLVDSTSPYGLTGAVISRDRAAIQRATDALRDAAGNFYINDKPTGAVVGQQPFGGARASGTNDKAGAQLNLYRWLSARTVKETYAPPTDYRYPFLEEE